MEVESKTQTFTLSPDVEGALVVYKRYAGIPDELSTIVDDAVREYLTRRGIRPPRGPLRITPSPHGSGDSTVSIEHDRVFAER